MKKIKGIRLNIKNISRIILFIFLSVLMTAVFQNCGSEPLKQGQIEKLSVHQLPRSVVLSSADAEVNDDGQDVIIFDNEQLINLQIDIDTADMENLKIEWKAQNLVADRNITDISSSCEPSSEIDTCSFNVSSNFNNHEFYVAVSSEDGSHIESNRILFQASSPDNSGEEDDSGDDSSEEEVREFSMSFLNGSRLVNFGDSVPLRPNIENESSQTRYQWFFKEEGSRAFIALVGKTSSQLNIDYFSHFTDGTYKLRAITGNREIVAEIDLNIVETDVAAPEIDEDQSNKAVNIDEREITKVPHLGHDFDFTIYMSSTSQGPFVYRLYQEQSGRFVQVADEQRSARHLQHTIENFQESNQGDYMVKVSGPGGNDEYEFSLNLSFYVQKVIIKEIINGVPRSLGQRTDIVTPQHYDGCGNDGYRIVKTTYVDYEMEVHFYNRNGRPGRRTKYYFTIDKVTNGGHQELWNSGREKPTLYDGSRAIPVKKHSYNSTRLINDGILKAEGLRFGIHIHDKNSGVSKGDPGRVVYSKTINFSLQDLDRNARCSSSSGGRGGSGYRGGGGGGGRGVSGGLDADLR